MIKLCYDIEDFQNMQTGEWLNAINKVIITATRFFKREKKLKRQRKLERKVIQNLTRFMLLCTKPFQCGGTKYMVLID